MAEPEERSNHLTSVIVRTSRQAGSTARGTFETCGRRATLRTPINKAVSADFFSSVRYAAINVAAISTSASQPKAARLHYPRAALTGVGKFSGGAGNAVVVMGSYCRAVRRLGLFFENPPRNWLRV